jgi:hypothetical protein
MRIQVTLRKIVYEKKNLGIIHLHDASPNSPNMQHSKKQECRNKQPCLAQIYSMRIAGPSSLNSAKDAFLVPALVSSKSSPTSFVQIHVEAYIFTLSQN